MFGRVAYLAHREVQEDRHLGAGSPTVTGEVVGVHDTSGKFEDSYVIVEFTTADGRDVRARVEEYRWRPEPRIGDRPLLRYDPAHPARYVRDDRMGDDPIENVMLTSFALGLLGFAVVAVRRR